MQTTNMQNPTWSGPNLGSGIGIGSAVTGPTVESPSEIRDAISYGEETLAQLHATISHLESRLDSGLTPIPPQAVSAGPSSTVPTPVMSNVRQRVCAINQGLVDAVQRLNALRGRVEI